MKNKIYLNKLTFEEIIKRLKGGEVVKIKDSNDFYKMVDGIIFKYIGEYRIVTCEIHIDEPYYYFEEEKPFEITETGLYKTRDGRKAFVYRVDRTTIFSVEYVIENDICRSATKYGFNLLGNTESNLDIVSKWEE